MNVANSTSLKSFLLNLADVFDGDMEIEKTARRELSKTSRANFSTEQCALPAPILSVMQQSDAHPLCGDIVEMPLDWRPPETSKSPLYAKHSIFKSHVELVGPDGLVKSESIRLGLYGMVPNSEYGIRTHPAEEIYIMLAGECFWKRGDAPYCCERPNGRSYHPSMMPHASKTEDQSFMSVYVWVGDLSTDAYEYSGLPHR
ncbi:dimethylsulfonioproprionate lyase family protein [Alphaproteobacteria bacterium]|nr:dimethylsulfonioproprionate lyase family protein [Alphaproteobacteria bacterium]